MAGIGSAGSGGMLPLLDSARAKEVSDVRDCATTEEGRPAARFITGAAVLPRFQLDCSTSKTHSPAKRGNKSSVQPQTICMHTHSSLIPNDKECVHLLRELPQLSRSKAPGPAAGNRYRVHNHQKQYQASGGSSGLQPAASCARVQSRSSGADATVANAAQ